MTKKVFFLFEVFETKFLIDKMSDCKKRKLNANDKERVIQLYRLDNNNVQFKTIENVPVPNCPLKRIFLKNLETGIFEKQKHYILCDHKKCADKTLLNRVSD